MGLPEVLVLVDPENTKQKCICYAGGEHEKNRRERGWVTLDKLTKPDLKRMATDQGLSPGPASKPETIASAVGASILGNDPAPEVSAKKTRKRK